MKYISFDVGIKNMAYCILEISNNVLNITDWRVINMIENENAQHSCNCNNKPKNKKTPPTICGRSAKYAKGDIYACEKHAKAHGHYRIPTKETADAYLKKQKLDALRGIYVSCLLHLQNPQYMTAKKDTLMQDISALYKKQCFNKLNTSTKSANETDLISIGRAMKHHFGNINTFDNIQHVIIENQISPIANRMKTIQGMLAQYFIMRYDENIHIAFISSSNKLKQFSTKPPPKLKNTLQTPSYNNKSHYKDNKNNGVVMCKQILENTPSIRQWIDSLDTKKKDDLADCFLQGIYYLKTNKLIYYADDLEIKFV